MLLLMIKSVVNREVTKSSVAMRINTISKSAYVTCLLFAILYLSNAVIQVMMGNFIVSAFIKFTKNIILVHKLNNTVYYHWHVPQTVVIVISPVDYYEFVVCYSLCEFTGITNIDLVIPRAMNNENASVSDLLDERRV